MGLPNQQIVDAVRGENGAPGIVARDYKMVSRILQPFKQSSENEQAAADYLESLLQGLSDAKEENILDTMARVCVASYLSNAAQFIHIFPRWNSRLLAIVQTHSQKSQLRCKAWSAVSGIFDRLAELVEVPGVRKDASQSAREAAQIMLKGHLPSSNQSGVAVLDTLQLSVVSSMLEAVGPALKGHLDALEKLCLKMLLGGKSSVGAILAASRVLSLIPQATGDGKAWELLVGKLVKTCKAVLCGVFMGKSSDAQYSARVEPPDEIKSLVGDQQWKPEFASAEKMAAWISTLSGILDCLERLMTHSQPFPVQLPDGDLFSQLSSIVNFRDMSEQLGGGGCSASAHLELTLQMPSLKVSALKLLQAWLQAGRTALTPYFGQHVRFLAQAMGVLKLSGSDWSVRVELYRTVKQALQLAGVGSVTYLQHPIKSCVISELFSIGAAAADKSVEQPAKKRKKSHGASEEVSRGHDRIPVRGQELESKLRLQQSCVEMLAQLLQAGGGGVSEQDRLSAELQILHVVHSSKTMVDSCTSECLPISTTSVIVEHHLSVLQVLRAVVLSPSPGRPLLLPEAIQQFELGLHSPSSKVQQCCTDALSACNALLHPRQSQALPYPSNADESLSLSSAVELLRQAVADGVAAYSARTQAEPLGPQTSPLLPQHGIRNGRPNAESSDRGGLLAEKNLAREGNASVKQRTSEKRGILAVDAELAATDRQAGRPDVDAARRSLDAQTVHRRPEESQDIVRLPNKPARLDLSNEPDGLNLPNKPNSGVSLGGSPQAKPSGAVSLLDQAAPSGQIAPSITAQKLALFDSDDDALPEIDLGVDSEED